jgi:hypoxanthine-guanine phosphoribosyltransferase
MLDLKYRPKNQPYLSFSMKDGVKLWVLGKLFIPFSSNVKPELRISIMIDFLSIKDYQQKKEQNPKEASFRDGARKRVSNFIMIKEDSIVRQKDGGSFLFWA